MKSSITDSKSSCRNPLEMLCITEDGYLKTNILEYGYLYEIGTEAAENTIIGAVSIEKGFFEDGNVMVLK